VFPLPLNQFLPLAIAQSRSWLESAFGSSRKLFRLALEAYIQFARSGASSIIDERSIFRVRLIDPFPQFFPGFEEGKFFGAYENSIAGFWVPSGVTFIFFDKETAQPTNFNPVTPGHGIGHVIEKYMYHFGRIRFGNIGFGF
jgi:hypothetical protein